MRSLASYVAQQAAPALMRAYAGAAGAVVPASSPFLRFSNPYPTPVDHTPLLSTIPDTKVRAGAWMLLLLVVDPPSWLLCSGQSCLPEQKERGKMHSDLQGGFFAVWLHPSPPALLPSVLLLIIRSGHGGRAHDDAGACVRSRHGDRSSGRISRGRLDSTRALAAVAAAPFRRNRNRNTTPCSPFFAPSSPTTTTSSHQQNQKITTLDNGMRVATEANPHAETATVGVWINAGSRFEGAADNGAAHFLEHLLFKGTQRRTVRDLEVEIENMGGALNAYTGREQTCYYAKVMKRDVGKAVDILSDILLSSRLDERAIERERDVILREMEEVNKQTSEVVFDHLHATAFQHSPLGRTILGPEANIRSLTRQQLAGYMAEHYRGPRMVLAAAGAVDHDDLVKLASKAFASVPDEDRTVRQLVAAEPAPFTGSSVYDRSADTDACSFAIAWKGASWTDPDSVPLMVMQTMLGGWDKNNTVGRHAGSLLTQKIAADRESHFGRWFCVGGELRIALLLAAAATE